MRLNALRVEAKMHRGPVTSEGERPREPSASGEIRPEIAGKHAPRRTNECTRNLRSASFATGQLVRPLIEMVEDAHVARRTVNVGPLN